MNAELPTTRAAESTEPTHLQEHRVSFYIKSFDNEFPERPPQELEAACLQAYEEQGHVRCREKLEARAREILMA